MLSCGFVVLTKIKDLAYKEVNGKISYVVFQGESYYRKLNYNADVKKFVGEYEHLPVDNKYHDVSMAIENGNLIWRNKAGIWWKMSYKNGQLRKWDDKIYKSQVCFGAVLQTQLKN